MTGGPLSNTILAKVETQNSDFTAGSQLYLGKHNPNSKNVCRAKGPEVYSKPWISFLERTKWNWVRVNKTWLNFSLSIEECLPSLENRRKRRSLELITCDREQLKQKISPKFIWIFKSSLLKPCMIPKPLLWFWFFSGGIRICRGYEWLKPLRVWPS